MQGDNIVKMKIVFLLFSRIHLLDLAGAAQVFYEAGNLGDKKYDLLFASVNQSQRSEQGLLLSELRALQTVTLQKNDLIMIPGADSRSIIRGALDEEIEAASEWVRTQRQHGVFVGAICSGALILAKMGLLDGIECTTHWKCMDYLESNFPKVKVVRDRLYCLHQGLFTSAGMTAGTDMALALVEQWDSPLVAAKVAQEMVINIRQPKTGEQKNIFLDYKNYFNPDVHNAQKILTENLDASFTIEDLAQELGMSSRHLTRLFKDHTGQTIQAYRDKLRVNYGEKLLLTTDLPIKEIAHQCGFKNVRQFMRLWKLKKGYPPGKYRRQERLRHATSGGN